MQKSISNKEKVLVVDDEASIRRILDTRLSMIGYIVITACDGEEALSLFRKEAPNLVIPVSYTHLTLPTIYSV